jgi:hypothetical protein
MAQEATSIPPTALFDRLTVLFGTQPDLLRRLLSDVRECEFEVRASFALLRERLDARENELLTMLNTTRDSIHATLGSHYQQALPPVDASKKLLFFISNVEDLTSDIRSFGELDVGDVCDSALSPTISVRSWPDSAPEDLALSFSRGVSASMREGEQQSQGPAPGGAATVNASTGAASVPISPTPPESHALLLAAEIHALAANMEASGELSDPSWASDTDHREPVADEARAVSPSSRRAPLAQSDAQGDPDADLGSAISAGFEVVQASPRAEAPVDEQRADDDEDNGDQEEAGQYEHSAVPEIHITLSGQDGRASGPSILFFIRLVVVVFVVFVVFVVLCCLQHSTGAYQRCRCQRALTSAESPACEDADLDDDDDDDDDDDEEEEDQAHKVTESKRIPCMHACLLACLPVLLVLVASTYAIDSHSSSFLPTPTTSTRFSRTSHPAARTRSCPP